jgi:hypothetical protein
MGTAGTPTGDAGNGNKGNGEVSLMLKIRAEALSTNLEKVRSFVRRAPNRRAEIEKVEADLRDLSEVIRNIRVSAYKAKVATEDESRDPPVTQQELRQRVTELQGKFSDVEAEVALLSKAADAARTKISLMLAAAGEMKQRCFVIQPDEAAGTVLINDLADRVKMPAASVADVEEKVAAGKIDHDTWVLYRKANLEGQAIFAEFGDFLGGMALRDTGFDEGISRMAEDLIRTYKTNREPDFPWLALPATRQEAVVKTLARIVTLGFPEWTIWGLPFTANAFWHVIARHDFKGDFPAVPERLQICLADAFATFTMGPAYAYAAFYLLLNPLEAWRSDAASERVGDDTRAQAILEMLLSMSANDTGADTGYEPIVKNLRTLWNGALTGAGVGAPTPQTISDNEQTVKTVQRLRSTLAKCDCASFVGVQWDQVETLDQIQTDRPLQIGELRGVLNSMWKARVDPAQSVKGVADRVQARILKKKGAQAAAPAPNMPSKVTIG